MYTKGIILKEEEFTLSASSKDELRGIIEKRYQELIDKYGNGNVKENIRKAYFTKDKNGNKTVYNVTGDFILFVKEDLDKDNYER